MSDRPNILLVMTDQQRGDCLGLEGVHPVLTPNQDGLAADGVRFSRAYATCPVCIPARRSLLTGQFPSSHGLLGYADRLEWDAPTLPSLLRDAGYQTALVGRSMHQYPVRKRFGFDEMITQDDYFEWLEHHLHVRGEHRADGLGQGPHLAAGIALNDWTARPWPWEEDLHLTNWTVTESRRFLRRRDPTCPFFLVVSFMAPHPPLTPPAFYFDRYLRIDLPAPAIGSWATPPSDGPRSYPLYPVDVRLEGEALRSALAGYYGSVNHVDDQIRRLVYDWNGIANFDLGNTVVVFASDHGEMLGDHYCWAKSRPYEGSARIPLIVRAPARFELDTGGVVDRPVCLEDIMPTVLELVGLRAPPSVDGRSLLPLMRGRDAEWRDVLHLEHANSGPVAGWHALTDGRVKYAWWSADGREQLFDLRADPRELHDLARERGAASLLAAWQKRLVAELSDRPEGFVRDGRLAPGADHAVVMQHPARAAT